MSDHTNRAQVRSREIQEKDNELEMLRGRLVEFDAQGSRLTAAQSRIRDLETLCKTQQQNQKNVLILI